MRAILVLLLTLVPLAALAKPAPNGTFRSDTGEVSLKYLGEGTVEVRLKTRYCALHSAQAGTFVPDEGIQVMNEKREPVLVIFYQRGYVIVYGELPAFKQQYCKGGLDATGVYKRATK